MKKTLKIIERIKNDMEDVILENDLKYLSGDITTLLRVYSADFCAILSSFFPGSTIMIDKSYRNCAVLINGFIYDATGVRKDVNNFHVANREDIGFIQKSFNQLSDEVIGKLMEKLEDKSMNKGIAFSLRKNRENLT